MEVNDLEEFITIIHSKTTARRAKKGLPQVTRPQLKKAHKLLQEDLKFANMNENQIVSYFIGYFSM